MLRSTTPYYTVLLSTTRYYKVLLSTTPYHKILQYYSLLHSITQTSATFLLMLPSSKAIFLKGSKGLVIDLSIVNQQVLPVTPKKERGGNIVWLRSMHTKKNRAKQKVRDSEMLNTKPWEGSHIPPKKWAPFEFSRWVGTQLSRFHGKGWHVILPWRDLQISGSKNHWNFLSSPGVRHEALDCWGLARWRLQAG